MSWTSRVMRFRSFSAEDSLTVWAVLLVANVGLGELVHEEVEAAVLPLGVQEPLAVVDPQAREEGYGPQVGRELQVEEEGLEEGQPRAPQ